MKLPDTELSPEAHEAIIACLRIAARRGRQLRLERERAVQAQNAQDTTLAERHATPEAGNGTGKTSNSSSVG